MRVAARIQTARGWSLRPLERLGRPKDTRRTWLAEGEHGTIIVKARAGPFSTTDDAWGYCLPVGDIVHGDLNLTNVLVHDGTITGVVDWDHIGVGSRATDLTGLLFDCHRLQSTGNDASTAPNGGARLVRRIVEIAGADGLRCVITYGAIARLAVSAQRGEEIQLAMWRRVTHAILESVCHIC
jgi:hypothetical protein